MAGSRGIRAGRAFVELGVDDRIQAGLNRARKRLDNFGKGLASVGARGAALGSAIAAPLGAAVRVFASAGDALDKLSKRTGFSVETLSELGFAAEQSGSNVEELENGIRRSQRAVDDLRRGLSTQTDAFSALNLAFEDLKGLSPEEQFLLIGDRLSQIEDASKRAAVAQQILGRAGTRLLPLFADGAAGVAALRDEARALGLTISTRTASDAALLTDRLNILRRVARVVAITVGAALAPSVGETVMRLTEAAGAAIDFASANGELIALVGKAAAVVVAGSGAIIGLGFAAIGAASFFGVLSSAVSLALSPIGLLVGASAAALAAILKLTGGGAAAMGFLRDAVGGVLKALSGTRGGLGDLETAWLDTIDLLSVAWSDFTRFVSSAFEAAVNEAAKILVAFDPRLSREEANRQIDALDAESRQRQKEIKRRFGRSLDELRREREDAETQRRRRAEESGTTPEDFASRIQRALDGVATGVERSGVTSRGTFSGREATRLGVADRDRAEAVAKETAEQARQIAEDVREIARRAATSPGLVFTS